MGGEGGVKEIVIEYWRADIESPRSTELKYEKYSPPNPCRLSLLVSTVPLLFFTESARGAGINLIGHLEAGSFASLLGVVFQKSRYDSFSLSLEMLSFGDWREEVERESCRHAMFKT
ncbi:hypothetical protein TNCV_2880351 [Trichonephila clavipes]|uniref:Uncharacterized protein n=1 Tax=Trichonephila clavipes TaxID=2585209 RepID=A0A8X6W1S8_TRICX|nr:hypothetical protein TNCV_2880351 [Trichonephila clavipes]